MLIKSDAKNQYDSTALMRASENGCKEIVQMLIKSVANVDAKNNDGNTALMLASTRGHKEIAEILQSLEN